MTSSSRSGLALSRTKGSLGSLVSTVKQCQNKAVKPPVNSDLNDDLLLTRQPGEVGGDAVLYADPHSSAALAKSMEQALFSPGFAGALAKLGRERARQFTWERTDRAVLLREAMTLTQDATGTLSYLQFEATGADRIKVDLAVSYIDHNMMQGDFRNADDHIYLQELLTIFSKL